MSALAFHLETFLREYLPRDRRASVHTCEAHIAHEVKQGIAFDLSGAVRVSVAAHVRNDCVKSCQR